jgi:hypothetical protein
MSEIVEENTRRLKYRTDYSDFPINMPLATLRLSEAIFEDMCDDSSLDPEIIITKLRKMGLLSSSDAISVMNHIQSFLQGSFSYLSMYEHRELEKYAKEFLEAGMDTEEAISEIEKLGKYSSLAIKLFSKHYDKLIKSAVKVYPPFTIVPKS